MRPQLHYSASQEAVPPPLQNFLSPEFAPALTVMEQFEADLLRMDEEHLQHRERATPEVPSPFPDDGLPSDSTLFGRSLSCPHRSGPPFKAMRYGHLNLVPGSNKHRQAASTIRNGTTKAPSSASLNSKADAQIAHRAAANLRPVLWHGPLNSPAAAASRLSRGVDIDRGSGARGQRGKAVG
ncbi:hypothetical protein J4E91_009709 [Alternaria rosae]|nr:hypothetical protein J4E91_009709 [Alternaria rosae]